MSGEFRGTACARTGPRNGPIRAFRGCFCLYGSRRWTYTSTKIGLHQRLAAQEDCPEEGGLVEVGEFGEGPAGAGEEEVGALAGGDGAGNVA